MSEPYEQFANQVRKLVAREALAGRLRSARDDELAAVAKELGVSEPMAKELRAVLVDVEAQRRATSESGGTRQAGNAASDVEIRVRSQLSQAQDFLDASFRQLKAAYFTSLGMSIFVFLAGMAFLAIAAWRAASGAAGAETTAVVGGIGVVQIVALFYKDPVRTVGRAVSNAQQARMAIMSYMLGVALIGENVYRGAATDAAQKQLADLTQRTMVTLEEFTEGAAFRARASRRAREAVPSEPGA